MTGCFMAKMSIIERLKLYNERFCQNLSHGDENCHEIFEFVNRHSKLILSAHYFLDIHGFDKDIGYDICLGIGEYEKNDYPFLQDIVKIATQYTLRVVVNHPNYMGINGFCGRYLRKYAKTNVIQMEIHKYLRDFYQNPDIVKNATLPFLQDIINCYR